MLEIAISTITPPTANTSICHFSASESPWGVLQYTLIYLKNPRDSKM